MNHGPFYRSAELVAGVHSAEDGIIDGFRATHAFGPIYAGTFTATPVAKTLSRAAHFQGTPVPVTTRFCSPSSRGPQRDEDPNGIPAEFVIAIDHKGGSAKERSGKLGVSGGWPFRR